MFQLIHTFMLVMALLLPTNAPADTWNQDKEKPIAEPTIVGSVEYGHSPEEVGTNHHLRCTLTAYDPQLRDGSVRASAEQFCTGSTNQTITACLMASRWWGWEQVACKSSSRFDAVIQTSVWGCKPGTYDYETWADASFLDDTGWVDSPIVRSFPVRIAC